MSHNINIKNTNTRATQCHNDISILYKINTNYNFCLGNITNDCFFGDRDRPPQTATVQAEDGDSSVGLGGSTELRSLSEGSTYEAWVAAHSAAGEGEPSAPQPATTTPRGIFPNLFTD